MERLALCGKPRGWPVRGPIPVSQGLQCVTLCPLTSTLIEAPLVRLSVQPTPSNGLRKPSQLMIDKLFTVPMAAIGEVIGVLEPAAMADLDLALRSWLELG